MPPWQQFPSADGPVQFLIRSIDSKEALEMLFFGELIPAPEAKRMCLISRVLADEQLEGEMRERAVTVAAQSLVATQNAK